MTVNKMLNVFFVLLIAASMTPEIPDAIWWPMWGLGVGFAFGWNLPRATP